MKQYIKHQGKTFIISYDKIGKCYLFYEIKHSKQETPSQEDMKYLYEKYNSKIEKQESKKQLSNMIKRVKAYLLFFLMGSSIYQKNFNIPYSKFLLKETLNINDNLTEVEKEYILSKQNFLKENEEYISMEEVISRFEDLDIDYNLQLDEYCTNNAAVAYYNFDENNIFLGYTSSFDNTLLESFLKSNLDHEIYHTFSSSVPSVGLGLYEAMTETFAYEYGNNFDNTKTRPYFTERMCLYSLLEIVDKEVLEELFFRGDVNPLIKELESIVEDEEMAYSLVKKIDSLLEYEKKLSQSILLSDEEFTKLNIEYLKTRTEIVSLIKKYYETKNNTPLKENEDLRLYLVYSDFYSSLENNIHAIEIFPKGYFCEEFIKNHPNTIYKAFEGISSYYIIDSNQKTKIMK